MPETRLKHPHTARRGALAAPSDGVSRAAYVGLAALSAGAAAVHFAVIPDHLREERLFGGFFVVVAIFQATWSAALLARPSNRLFWVGALGNALIVGVWALSRTTGLPIGPEPWVAEPVSLADAVASTYEVVIVTASLYLAIRGSPRAEVSRRVQNAAGAAAVPVLALAALAVVTGHGHAADGGEAAAFIGHHLFHLVFIGGAAVVFWSYVVFDALQHGRPSFSWRLRAEQ